MGSSIGPNAIEDGLVFGYDTGYPFMSSSIHAYKFNLGEPTTTFDVGNMLPTSPTSFFSSSATYHSNLHGTLWDWAYFPNSNIHPSGGMEWIPGIEGPTFTGAWKMKKRPGGNSESNFQGVNPGTVSTASAHTVSVMCKTTQANCFRIHINTTKDGSSFWGYASGYHSGGGEWEKLSVTVPANAGNTSINTLRCQGIGTTVTADAFWRDYQVEINDNATQFIYNGTRSVSGSLLDITGKHEIDVSNVSYNSNAQITFDGTDDYLEVADNADFDLTSAMSFEFVVKADSSQGNSFPRLIDKQKYLVHLTQTSPFTIAMNIIISGGVLRQTAIGSAFVADKYTHIVCTYDSTLGKIYVDGELKLTKDFTTASACTTNNVSVKFGGNGTSARPLNGELPISKVYNKVLSADEVAQSFRAIRSRFNI